jgi:hypothetical protein
MHRYDNLKSAKFAAFMKGKLILTLVVHDAAVTYRLHKQ